MVVLTLVVFIPSVVFLLFLSNTDSFIDESNAFFFVNVENIIFVLLALIGIVIVPFMLVYFSKSSLKDLKSKKTSITDKGKVVLFYLCMILSYICIAPISIGSIYNVSTDFPEKMQSIKTECIMIYQDRPTISYYSLDFTPKYNLADLNGESIDRVAEKDVKWLVGEKISENKYKCNSKVEIKYFKKSGVVVSVKKVE